MAVHPKGFTLNFYFIRFSLRKIGPGSGDRRDNNGYRGELGRFRAPITDEFIYHGFPIGMQVR